VRSEARGATTMVRTRRFSPRVVLLGAVALCASTVVVITGLQSAMAAPSASAADRDCSDFDNQRQAQNHFIDMGGPRRDPDRLDADGNGVACESLACPCSRARARPSPQPPRGRAQTIRARVTSVVDGDTIRVRPLERTRRRRYTVRLIGIDTPEVLGGVEAAGRRASARLKRLATGRRVLLRTDPTQAKYDRYDRLLAYAKLRGGPNAALAQLRAGWARVYVDGGRPFRRMRAYRRAQRSARRADRGVWGRRGGRFYGPAPATAAQRRARIASMGMRLYGRGRPGPAYRVEVAVRVRLCGRRGRAVFRITETSSPPGRNRPVFARSRRERRRAQGRRCQTSRFSWVLADRFFGVARYRVAVRARTSRTGWSRVAARHVDTYD
jgi:endonuclease YncB( thermonuclease family)